MDDHFDIRQLKISEVVRKGDDERKKMWKTTIPCSDTLKTSTWQFPKSNSVIRPPKLVPHQVEYMEVENIDSAQLSDSSSYPVPTNSDASTKEDQRHLARPGEHCAPAVCEKDLAQPLREEEQNAYQGIKKKFRPLVQKPAAPAKKKGNMCSYCCCFFILLPVLFVTLGIILKNDEFKANVCNRRQDFLNATIELPKRIHGQSTGIDSLLKALNSDSSNLKIILLMGGTGVGKSFTAEILRKNFPYQDAISVYVSQSKETINIDNFYTQSSNLVILENLKGNNLLAFQNYVASLRDYEQYCITVLAIFKTDHVSDNSMHDVDLKLIRDINAVANNFRKEDVDTTVVPFEYLDGATLEVCITDAAKNSNLELTADQIDRVKKMLLLSNSGCKGAHAKVQVIGRE